MMPRTPYRRTPSGVRVWNFLVCNHLELFSCPKGGFILLALPAFLPAVISSFLPEIRGACVPRVSPLDPSLPSRHAIKNNASTVPE